MELETLLWFYFPILIAFIGTIFSVRITKKRPSFLNLAFSFLSIILNGFSIYILLQILRGAWPSYLPHLGIGTTTFLTLMQYRFSKTKTPQ